jgi:hypothetical protein
MCTHSFVELERSFVVPDGIVGAAQCEREQPEVAIDRAVEAVGTNGGARRCRSRLAEEVVHVTCGVAVAEHRRRLGDLAEHKGVQEPASIEIVAVEHGLEPAACLVVLTALGEEMSELDTSDLAAIAKP